MLVRLARTDCSNYGNFGVIVADGRKPLVTCEQPWRSRSDDGASGYPYGKPYKSCIPTGRYDLVWHHSNKYGFAWHIVGQGVDLTDNGKRFACLFHPANWPHQLQGCVSLGHRVDFVASRYGVSSSKSAILEFGSWLNENERHTLVIQ